MLHFKNYFVSNNGNNNPLSESFLPVRLQKYGAPQQSTFLQQVVVQQGRSIASLTSEEYCAAHLASLAEAAIEVTNLLLLQTHERSGLGFGITTLICRTH
jgi:hypothetical protein